MTILQKNLTAVCAVVGLLTIGGNCRGALAQAPARELSTLSVTCPPEGCEPVYVDDNKVDWQGHTIERKKLRTTPMTAAEWTQTYDACVAHLGTPYILAGRHPGVSAGVGCVFQD